MHCSSPPGYGRRAGWPVVVGVADPRAFAASLVAEVRNMPLLKNEWGKWAIQPLLTVERTVERAPGRWPLSSPCRRRRWPAGQALQGSSVPGYDRHRRSDGLQVKPCARAKPLAGRHITHSKFKRARNIDDPGRIPFESSRSIKAGQSVFVFATVPAGHRLVVQHVSAHVNFQSVLSSSSLLDIFLSAGPGGSSFIPSFLSNSVQFDQRFSSTLTQEICPNSASQ